MKFFELSGEQKIEAVRQMAEIYKTTEARLSRLKINITVKLAAAEMAGLDCSKIYASEQRVHPVVCAETIEQTKARVGNAWFVRFKISKKCRCRVVALCDENGMWMEYTPDSQVFFIDVEVLFQHAINVVVTLTSGENKITLDLPEWEVKQHLKIEKE